MGTSTPPNGELCVRSGKWGCEGGAAKPNEPSLSARPVRFILCCVYQPSAESQGSSCENRAAVGERAQQQQLGAFAKFIATFERDELIVG